MNNSYRLINVLLALLATAMLALCVWSIWPLLEK